MSGVSAAAGIPTHWRRLAGALAGPAVIVLGVGLVLNGFVRGLITMGDPLRFWMPTYCYLGRTLSSGHIPAWNPFVMGGAPFAADPQSGWMYAPVMVLFTALPCDVAVRVLLVMQPALAGLGVYWFARSEGLGRPAATLGGAALSLAIAAGDLASSVPFAGSLAWAAVTLAATSRALRASTRTGRLAWAALAALSWGQLAGSHFSVGTVFGTGALLTYLAVMAGSAWREDGRIGLRRVAGLAGLLAVVSVGLNLAYLVPRLAYLPRTELGMGYERLRILGAELAGTSSPTSPLGRGVGPGWPLKLSTFPGVYLGGALLPLFAGAWSRARRALFWGFAAFAAACYLVSLTAVASHVPPSIRSWRLVDMYLHNPEWFAYPMLLGLAVMAALGLQAWLDAADGRSRLAMLAPAALVWLVLPLVIGSGSSWAIVFPLSAFAGVGLLWVAGLRPALAPLVAAAVAVELTVAGTVGNRVEPLPFSPVPTLLQALANPNQPAGRFLVAGPIVAALQAGGLARYARLPHPGKVEPLPALDVDGMVPNHSDLFAIEDVGSFNPAQLTRYWVFMRAAQGLSMKYNRAFLARPAPIALDLLQVGWLVAPEDRPVPSDAAEVTRDGQQVPWILYRRADPPSRAEVVPSWQVVVGDRAYPSASLDAVLAPGFDPARTVVLEEDPGMIPTGSTTPSRPGTATFEWTGRQAARVEVESDVPAVVLIRNAFDQNWHATVDGRPAPVLAADYVDQGVPVPAGRHTILLEYDDPAVGVGLAGSGAAGAALLVGLALAWRRDRAPTPQPASVREPVGAV